MRSDKAINRLLLTSNHLAGHSILPSNAFSTVSEGSKFSPNFKRYLAKDGEIKSFFHDLPLALDIDNGTANMVVEIPRWTNAKFEINTKLPGNPIVQDVKKGQPRFIKNLYPYHGYCHNYGAFSQTWEDITNSNGELQIYGDNDPVDVLEIGAKVYDVGDVINVKILGSLALIDDGELDWKVISINSQDPLCEKLHDINDIDTYCPGLLTSTREWIRNYKIPDGKPPNTFAFDGEYKNRQFTLELLQETHQAWNDLVHDKVTTDKSHKLPNNWNTTMKSSSGYTDKFNITPSPAQPDSSLPKDLSTWYYV